MKRTSIALTAAAGVFATMASADHNHSNEAIQPHGNLAHFTVPCTTADGNTDDYSLTIFPETGLQENYGGHFAAEFNFTTAQPISPYASPITEEFDTQTNIERFMFPLFALQSDENTTHQDSRTVLINNKAHTAQFDLYEEDAGNFTHHDNADHKVTCDIPDMGL